VKTRGVHHVSLDVDDLEAALHFYVDQLGFTALPRPDFGFAGAWLTMGDHQLHLLEISGPMPAGGGRHFALHVEDRDATIDELRALGITVNPSAPIPGAGLQAFLHDPAGNMVELIQPS